MSRRPGTRQIWQASAAIDLQARQADGFTGDNRLCLSPSSGEVCASRFPLGCPIGLLPGMGGTGELFEPFIQALLTTFYSLGMRYPTDGVLAYEALLKSVLPQLPQEPYIMLGESFSSLVAILRAHRALHRSAGLILCALSASSPRPDLQYSMAPGCFMCNPMQYTAG